MKLWEKVLNGGLILIFIGSISWFLVIEHNKTHAIKTSQSKEIVEESKKVDWEPLLPGMFSIAGIFLKYFLDERKKRKDTGKNELKDHLVFFTIEDLLENELRHKNFGSEGRNEVMRALITIQLDTYRTALQQFIADNPKFENFTEFRKRLRACIFNMVDATEDRWVERQIPQAIIDRYIAIYRQRIELLLGDVLTVSISNTDTLEALNVFLNEARVVFRTSLQDDAVAALRSMNGELSGLTFNGKAL